MSPIVVWVDPAAALLPIRIGDISRSHPHPPSVGVALPVVIVGGAVAVVVVSIAAVGMRGSRELEGILQEAQEGRSLFFVERWETLMNATRGIIVPAFVPTSRR